MRVLGYLADQRFAVTFRHPFLGLDFDVRIDLFLKGALIRLHLIEGFDALACGFDFLRVHETSISNGICQGTLAPFPTAKRPDFAGSPRNTSLFMEYIR